MSKFQNTYCSQCGKSFGPGDHGYSHCSDHRDLLASLRAAETISSQANEALADLNRLIDGAADAALAAIESALRSMPDDQRAEFNIDLTREALPKILRMDMENVIRPVEDHANDMANNLFDLTLELEEAAHAERAPIPALLAAE